MSFAAKGNQEILVAGCQDVMIKINVEKGVVSQTVRMKIQEDKVTYVYR